MRIPDPIPDLKVQVTRAIVEKMDGWSQENPAEILRTDQPRMSNLRNGRLARFSLEQLIRFVSRAHGVVIIEVTWPRRRWFDPTQP